MENVNRQADSNGNMSDYFIIKGRLPGFNEYINAERANRYKASKMKRDTEKIILVSIKEALSKGTLHKHGEECKLEITWIEPNNRRDGDNVVAFALKCIQDALVEMGVFPDDSRKYINGLKHTFMTNQRDPKIIVEIKEKNND